MTSAEMNMPHQELKAASSDSPAQDAPTPEGAPAPSPQGSPRPAAPGENRPEESPRPPAAPDRSGDDEGSYGHVDGDEGAEQELELYAGEARSTDENGAAPNSPFSSPVALLCFLFFGFVFGLIGFIVAWFIVRKEPPMAKSRALFFTAIGWVISAIMGLILLAGYGGSLFPTGNLSSPTGATGGSAW